MGRVRKPKTRTGDRSRSGKVSRVYIKELYVVLTSRFYHSHIVNIEMLMYLE